MSSTQRLPEHTVIARLVSAPYRFEFVQAVRLLDGWLGHSDTDRLSSCIRFRSRTRLGFATSQIDAIELEYAAATSTDAGQRPRITLTPTLPSLFGSTGELPYAASYRLMETHSRGRMESTQAFYDMLFHRSIELHYIASNRSRIFRSITAQGKPALLPVLMALTGVPAGSRQPGGIPDAAIASYAALLQRPVTSVTTLAPALADYLSLPVEIIQFLPDYYQLGEEERVQLGKRNHRLGRTLILGRRIPNFQRRIRLSIGPLKRQQYDPLLPEREGWRALKSFISLFKLSSLQLEVLLFLAQGETRQSRLGKTALGYGYHLGLTAHGPHYGAMRYALPTIATGNQP
ncbi:type VI secretion system baseplate subunit TssG [Duganella qianjiadongensis]|uniref:Type VI secretion system baseplate subunit TssG n=1 Tax=Duganella qianjiadongensis TaxID=2692176 RepID=A0ABW9VP50_9BURK|nr:type VI secretion system baseplate subunit TssG [Duganella qianjiadongensis]MYM41255.1 type VI secretion system baseplate subunit TssG [Duganella qianjiadongensis]